jgi:hypothetical protein
MKKSKFFAAGFYQRQRTCRRFSAVWFECRSSGFCPNIFSVKSAKETGHPIRSDARVSDEQITLRLEEAQKKRKAGAHRSAGRK